ncbi:MAG: NusG domain II-containing protein [Bacillota bacterium]|nr:NusG domain II-containing protein [Bacillota bacterium]HHU61410.1 NusG domain II-containing protein [Natronincola sp.]
MRFKEKVKGDFVLVVVLVIIGAFAVFYNQVVVPRRSPATKVVVEVEGQVVGEFELAEDMAPLRFETKHGFNTIEIKGGQVRVAEADCPDLLCVNTGWRQHKGQVIVCLPHYFIVRIVGDDPSPAELDGFTY